MSAVPKAVLYHFPYSIWSAVARLAIEEKGYAAEEIDLKVVDLTKGENYDPTFLRLNPKATVPTLVVPLSNTLSEEVDSRYKAITESIAIVEFLDKSRSFLSKTHTTSAAPAPALTPATIAATSIAKTIISDILHSQEASPKRLTFNNARDAASLRQLAKDRQHVVRGRQAALKKNITEGESGAVQVSEKTKSFWAEKMLETEALLSVLEAAEKAEEDLSEAEKQARLAFFQTGRQAWEIDLPKVLIRLSKEMIGPYSLGDQFSIADLHLAAWFTRVAKLCGVSGSDDGKTAVEKIESYIGVGAFLARDYSADMTRRGEKVAKLGVFWESVKGRESWQKIYGAGVF